MAINELLDPLSRIVSKEIYINDKKIDNKAVDDYIESLEIEVNYFRHSIICVFACFEDLFTLSIGKSINSLNEKDTIRIIFEDKAGCVFDKRFNIIKTIKIPNQITNRSQQWNVILEDIYGHVLNSPNYTRYLTEAGFSGTPFEICQKALMTLFIYPNELIELYKENKITFNAKRNHLDFIYDDNPTINYRFSKDLTPIENILNLANKYNIHLYQDFNNFNIIQNPTFENAEHYEDKTETALFKELCDGKKYPFKICDKIKQEYSLNANDKANYKISLNLGGKEQVIRELDFKNIIKILDINNNSEEFNDIRCENTIEVSNSYSLLSNILNDATKKYLKANNIIIYTRPILNYCIPGTLTTIDLATKSEFMNSRKQGDYRFSGIWLIRSTTLKILNNQFLIGRMILCRFDNPADNTNEEVENIITSNDDDFILTDKPEKPKNLEEFKEYYDSNNSNNSNELFLNFVNGTSDIITKFKSLNNQIPNLINSISNGESLLNNFNNTFESIKDISSLIKQVINIIMPSGASDNVSESISSTINNVYNKIKPFIDKLKEIINSINEYIQNIFNKLKEICNNINEYIKSITKWDNENISEISSRIFNNIKKYKNELILYIKNIKNMITSEINNYINSIKSYINKLIDTMSNNIYESINNSVIDKSEKTNINPDFLNSLIKISIKSFLIEPLNSSINNVYNLFDEFINKIINVENMINNIINNFIEPFNSIEKTIDESINEIKTNNIIPDRILNKVEIQGIDIFRKEPKEIINNFKSNINTNIENLKKKREQILKGLR